MRKIFPVIAILILPTLLLAQPGRKDIIEGNKLFAEQKYDEALNKYRNASIEDPENPLIHFNLANAFYKKKKYEDALKDYEKSLSVEDVLTQSKAYYNMGNTLYRLGKLPEAILAYKQALKLNPDDEDAKYNLEFVRRKLKENSQKQNQNQNQQQQQQQQQQQNQSQGENKQQDQNKEKQQQEKENQQQQEQQQQKQQQQQEKKEMTKEEAERILAALNKEDRENQKNRKIKSSGKIVIVKDW